MLSQVFYGHLSACEMEGIGLGERTFASIARRGHLYYEQHYLDYHLISLALSLFQWRLLKMAKLCTGV